MKKADSAKREIFLRLASKRHAHEQARKNVTYHERKSYLPHSILNGHLIEAPESISIYEAGSENTDFYIKTLDFIGKIEKNFAKKICKIDFSRTVHMSAAAVLTLCAAMTRARNNGAHKSIIIWSERGVVNRMLKAFKVGRIAKNQTPRMDVDWSRQVQIVSGTVVGNKDEEVVDYIKQKFFRKEMSPDQELLYSNAVSETILNVTRHAYPDSLYRDKTWWLIIEVIYNEIYLAIYDVGVGIPATVVKKKWFENTFKSKFPTQYREFMDKVKEDGHSSKKELLSSNISDSGLVYLSMMGDVSGEEESNKHGQGSKSIKALVSNTDDGHLWVFSNKGLCIYTGDETPDQIIDLPAKFPGTLIQWNIKFE